MNYERHYAILNEIRRMARELPGGYGRAISNRCDRVQILMNKRRARPDIPDPEDEAAHHRYQWQKVYDYMRAGNTITSLEAINLFGATRLSAIIFDIGRITGKAPARRRITVPTRTGRLVSVCEYWLEPDGTKTCPKCGRVLPLEQFAECPENPDGRTYYCKDCLAQFHQDETRNSATV